MNYFIYTSHHFTPHERYELNKLTSLPMCGFIAQLVEHRTGIRRGHGFESRWSLDFFRLLLSSCLNWKIYCDDHSSLWSTTAVQIYELFHIYFTSVLPKSANRLCGANNLGVVKCTRAKHHLYQKEWINLCIEWIHHFLSCSIIRATLRSLPSIALRIPTAHNFTRD